MSNPWDRHLACQTAHRAINWVSKAGSGNVSRGNAENKAAVLRGSAPPRDNLSTTRALVEAVCEYRDKLDDLKTIVSITGNVGTLTLSVQSEADKLIPAL